MYKPQVGDRIKFGGDWFDQINGEEGVVTKIDGGTAFIFMDNPKSRPATKEGLWESDLAKDGYDHTRWTIHFLGNPTYDTAVGKELLKEATL